MNGHFSNLHGFRIFEDDVLLVRVIIYRELIQVDVVPPRRKSVPSSITELKTAIHIDFVNYTYIPVGCTMGSQGCPPALTPMCLSLGYSLFGPGQFLPFLLRGFGLSQVLDRVSKYVEGAYKSTDANNSCIHICTNAYAIASHWMV